MDLPLSFQREVPCVFSQDEFDRFAVLSGDHNPIHVDPGYAARTPFGATVAHGMFLFSRLHALAAQTCPGLALQSQALMFPAPSYTDEPLVLALQGTPDASGGIDLRMQVRKPDGRLGLDGSARLAGAAAPLPAPLAQADAATPPGQAQAAPTAAGMADFPTRFQALRPGQSASILRAFPAGELADWAALAHAPKAPQEVPEPLIAALFSYLLGEEVPGHGTNYLKQSMHFHARAHAGEALTASVRITRLRADKSLVNLETRCTGAGDRILCTGQALVLFKC